MAAKEKKVNQDLWAVQFNDHIHTDRAGQLAIFVSEKAATDWMKKHGIPGCRVRKAQTSTTVPFGNSP